MKRMLAAATLGLIVLPVATTQIAAQAVESKTASSSFQKVVKAVPTAGKAKTLRTNSAVPKTSSKLVLAQPNANSSQLTTLNGGLSKQARAASAEASSLSSLNTVYFETDNKNRIIDRYIGSSPQRVIDDRTGQTSFNWSANSKSVNLSWWKPKGVSATWVISKNGQPIAKTDSTSFTDNSVDRSRVNEYSVEAQVEQLKKSNDPDSKYTHAYSYGTEVPKGEKVPVNESVESKSVLSAAANADIMPKNAALAKAKVAQGSAQFRYASFIPDKKIKQPPFCSNGFDSYHGDGRAFRNSKTINSNLSSRGENQAGVTVQGNKNHLDFTKKHVGETIAYKKDGSVADRKTASDSGLSTTLGSYGILPDIRFKQSIGNPLCDVLAVGKAPAIDVDMHAIFDPSGSTEVKGSHDGAPNHELTYNLANSKGRSYGCLYRFQYSSFNSLLPPMDVTVNRYSTPMNGKFPRDCAIRK